MTAGLLPSYLEIYMELFTFSADLQAVMAIYNHLRNGGKMEKPVVSYDEIIAVAYTDAAIGSVQCH